MAERDRDPDITEQVRRLYQQSEGELARAMENVVAMPSFGRLLGRLTENAVAITRIGNDALDLMVRNLRLAGRQDVTRLGRQIARTEDKLELLLQEVERLTDELEARDGESGGSAAGGAQRVETSGPAPAGAPIPAAGPSGGGSEGPVSDAADEATPAWNDAASGGDSTAKSPGKSRSKRSGDGLK